MSAQGAGAAVPTVLDAGASFEGLLTFRPLPAILAGTSFPARPASRRLPGTIPSLRRRRDP